VSSSAWRRAVFVIGAALAWYRLGAGVILIASRASCPTKTHRTIYELENGHPLRIHQGLNHVPAKRVVIADDLCSRHGGL
jgi:adenine/guanine phosphoribosyltransferase-like PRPP-binding protein